MAEGGTKLDISCTICFEDYDTPKVLPCGHTLCCQCVGKMLARQPSSLQCPKCRMEFTLPKSGKAENLPTNFALMTIINDESKEKTENVSKKGNTPPMSESPCSLHNAPMKFYCKSCKVDVCAECLHNGHKPDKHEIVSKSVTSSYFAEKLFAEILKLEVKLQHYRILYNGDKSSEGEMRLQASCKQNDKISEDKITNTSQNENQENLRKDVQKMLSELVQKTQACVDTLVGLHEEKKKLITYSRLINKTCTLMELKFRIISFKNDCTLDEILKYTEALKAHVKSMKAMCYTIPTEVDIKFLETFQRCLENITKTATKPVSQQSTANSFKKMTEEKPDRNRRVKHHYVFVDVGYFYSDSEDDDYYQYQSENKCEAQGDNGNNKENDNWVQNNGNDNANENNGEGGDEDGEETYYEDGWGNEDEYDGSSGGEDSGEDGRDNLSNKGSEYDGDYEDDYEENYEDIESDDEGECEGEFEGDGDADNSDDYEGSYEGESDHEEGYGSELGGDYGGEDGELNGDDVGEHGTDGYNNEVDHEGDSCDSYEDEYDGDPDEYNGDNGCDYDGNNIGDNGSDFEGDDDDNLDDEYQSEVCEGTEDNGGEPGDDNGDPDFSGVDYGDEGDYGDVVEGEQDLVGDNGYGDEGNVEEFCFDYGEGYGGDDGGEHGGDFEYGYYGDQGDDYGDYYGDDYGYDYDY